VLRGPRMRCGQFLTAPPPMDWHDEELYDSPPRKGRRRGPCHRARADRLRRGRDGRRLCLSDLPMGLLPRRLRRRSQHRPAVRGAPPAAKVRSAGISCRLLRARSKADARHPSVALQSKFPRNRRRGPPSFNAPILALRGLLSRHGGPFASAGAARPVLRQPEVRGRRVALSSVN